MNLRLLIDTHALIWAVDDPQKFTATTRQLVSNRANDIYVSAATIWEIAIKVGVAKLQLSLAYRP